MKRCYKCKTNKEENSFTKGQTWCRECRAIHRKKVIEKTRKYYRNYCQTERGKESIKKCEARLETKEKRRQAQKRFRIRHPEIDKIRQEYHKQRRQTDMGFRIACIMRNRVGVLIKKGDKSGRTMELLGCNMEHFIKHIESQWREGMNWQTYGRLGWHLDHIKPCASFDLTDSEQQKKCFHWSNYQPLWYYENGEKGAKLDWKLKQIPPTLEAGGIDHPRKMV